MMFKDQQILMPVRPRYNLCNGECKATLPHYETKWSYVGNVSTDQNKDIPTLFVSLERLCFVTSSRVVQREACLRRSRELQTSIWVFL